jgi:MFS family permease
MAVSGLVGVGIGQKVNPTAIAVAEQQRQFRGIHINPLAPGNSSYLLWILLGYMVVAAVLLVTFGRLSDMVGRVKMYNLGFAILALASRYPGQRAC